MKKILLTAVALSILALSVSPALAGGKKPAPRHSPAPKTMHRPPATTHRGSSYHGKPTPAAKYHAVPKHTPTAKYHSTPKYAPSAKYAPAAKSKTAPKYTPVSKHSPSKKYTPAKKYTPSGTHTKTKVAHHGVKFSHGYYFKKSNPPKWTKTSYSNRWRTWFYFVPAAGTWYYYHAAGAVYYPMDYASVVAPTVVAKSEGARTEGSQTDEGTEREGTQTEEEGGQTEQTEEPPAEQES